MKIKDRHVLVCDCERTMSLNIMAIAAAVARASDDAAAPAEQPGVVHTHLCRSQIEAFRQAVTNSAAAGEPAPLVCCTQEAPLFREIAEEAAPGSDPTFVNIRETAGWSEAGWKEAGRSDEGRDAVAKVAALLAEAAVPVEPSSTVTLRSDGVALVYGAGETAMAAARRLSGRLNVTCLLTKPGDAVPPPVMDVPLFTGRIRNARGHLGAFQLTVDGFAPYLPASRSTLGFEPGKDGVASTCDVILDLSGGPPLFPAFQKRDGYVRAEPSDAVGVQRALFDISDMVGEFEKPRYIRVDPALCAHSRNQIVGCTLCLDACPTGAITPAGDHTAVDAHVCSGHGACASVCPTGAIVFDVPKADAVFERLRVLTRAYRAAGGERMVLLVHDPREGFAAISAVARNGRGLPANVVPFALNEITQVGLDFLLTALAYGVAQVRLLAHAGHRDALDPLRRHAAIIDAVTTGLGYGAGRIVIDDEPDPEAWQARLYAPLPAPVAATTVDAARHAAIGDKRTITTLALDHLHARAPRPVDVIAVPEGAPFGLVHLDPGRCTLCLACVGACPTGALGDNPQRPQLTFTEIACVQCGICRNTCPEDAISLEPRINLAPEAKHNVVLKEEEPFACIRCGKPFATRSIIDRLVERMAGHAMFAGGGRVDLIKMCEDCRIKAQFEQDAPFAAGQRPVTRTTDDYLREKEASAGSHMETPGGSRPGPSSRTRH